MPIMNGYEATVAARKFITENGLEQPYIVACTGNVESSQIEKAFECQFDEVVSKPANTDLIKAILADIIIIA